MISPKHLSILALSLFAAGLPACADDAPAGSSAQNVSEGEAAPARYPIILAHGFNASPTSDWGFYGVEEDLGAPERGHAVFSTTVPPFDSIEVRAKALAEQVDAILQESDAAKVNIIAHSMGGLDARYLISSLGYGDRVASLTTISTPHQGSAVATMALKKLGLNEDAFLAVDDDVLNGLARAWGRSFSELAEEPRLRAALIALSETSAEKFNADNVDDERVAYQSYAGVSSAFGIPGLHDGRACGRAWARRTRTDLMDALLVPAAGTVAHGWRLDPNDGMVTVDSARWGEFRGCIRADHLDEVGQVKDDGRNIFTHFDHIAFYRGIASDLAGRGF